MVSPRARGGRSSAAAACSGTYHANVIVDVVDLPVRCGDQHLGRQQLLHSEHDAVLAPHAHTRAGTPTQPTHTCALVVARLWLCECDAAPRLPLRRTHFAQWPSERTRPGTPGHRASTSRTNHRTAQRNATENSGEQQRGHKHTHSAGSKAKLGSGMPHGIGCRPDKRQATPTPQRTPAPVLLILTDAKRKGQHCLSGGVSSAQLWGAMEHNFASIAQIDFLMMRS